MEAWGLLLLWHWRKECGLLSHSELECFRPFLFHSWCQLDEEPWYRLQPEGRGNFHLRQHEVLNSRRKSSWAKRTFRRTWSYRFVEEDWHHHHSFILSDHISSVSHRKVKKQASCRFGRRNNARNFQERNLNDEWSEDWKQRNSIMIFWESYLSNSLSLYHEFASKYWILSGRMFDSWKQLLIWATIIRFIDIIKEWRNAFMKTSLWLTSIGRPLNSLLKLCFYSFLIKMSSKSGSSEKSLSRLFLTLCNFTQDVYFLDVPSLRIYERNGPYSGWGVLIFFWELSYNPSLWES